MREGTALAQRRHPTDISDGRLIAVLVRYVPPIIARSIVERARREAATGPDVSWTDPNGLLDRISVGVRLFVAAEHQSAVLREITDLAAADADSEPSNLPLLDDAAPTSTLKPSSHRMWERSSDSTRSLDASHPGAVPRDRVPDTGRALDPSASRTLEIPRNPEGLGAPPSGRGAESFGSPPSVRSAESFGSPQSGARNVDVLAPPIPAPRLDEAATTRRDPQSSAAPAGPTPAPGSPVRRDTEVANPFGAPTRRTPQETTPTSRGVFPTTPRVTSSTATRLPAQRSEKTTLGASSPVIPPPPLGIRDAQIIGGFASTVPSARLPGVVEIRSSPHDTPTTPAGAMRRTLVSAAERAEAREITITLATEHDIPRARQVAREICETLGTRALTQQRLVTIVSELGRNMVLYAGGGKITLRPPISSNRRVVVLAVDQGPGIANLSDIMSGRYKSRSGLGLGIVGTKRLADAFHIETGRNGTAISVEVIV